MVVQKLLHGRKITAVLIVIQFVILVLGIVFGIVGRMIHNDLMSHSMEVFSLIVSGIAAAVLFLERKNIKPRKNAILKNKKVFWFFYVLLIILFLLVSVLTALFIWEDNKEVVTPPTRTIEVDSNNISVSFNMPHDNSEYDVLNGDGIQYGKYDEYTDSEGNMYLYLHGTDVYCGFNNFVGGQSEGTMEENAAKEKATAYLKKIIEDISVYKLEKATLRDWDSSYDVSFRRYIEEFPTEEVVRISINGDGKVDSYSDFLAGCFDQTSVDSSKVRQAIADVKKTLDSKYSGTTYEVDKQCITYKDGDLFLKTECFYLKGKKGGTGIMMEDTIMTSLN